MAKTGNQSIASNVPDHVYRRLVKLLVKKTALEEQPKNNKPKKIV